MARVLIVDDNKELNSALARAIGKRFKVEVDCCFSLASGLKAARERSYDVIFLDVLLPDGNGLDKIGEFKKTPGRPEIIILTGKPRLKGVELALNSGAWNYVRKPCKVGEMMGPLEEALQFRKDKADSRATTPPILEGIVGSSAEIRSCHEKVAQAAGWDQNVLLTGETGTGKELFARAIHRNSQRAHKPFVTVDCTVLHRELAESCLFGHLKGAFTNADQRREGLIRKADGGTLFLDEVGELPLDVQKKFLRVLEEHCFIAVGDNEEQKCDFRLIAATNRDLQKMVEEKKISKRSSFSAQGNRYSPSPPQGEKR